MTIKDLCFQAQSSLQSRYATAVKRSHLFEVLAALFGFRSHAALSAEALYAQTAPSSPSVLVDEAGALARARRCSYTAEDSKAIVETLSSLARAQRLCVTSVDAVLRDLDATEVDGSDAGSVDDDTDADEFQVKHDQGTADELVDAGGRSRLALDSPVLFSSLVAAADRGNANAHLALALLHEDRDDELEDGRAPGLDGSYWFEQMQGGRVLNGPELEWAQEYERAKTRREGYVHHIRRAAEGGNAEAALRLAELSPDEQTFSAAMRVVQPAQSSRLADIAIGLGREADAIELLRTAGTNGDVDAMWALVYRLDEAVEAWTWVYVAEMCGSDFRRTEAIHEDGTPYDDDVGGPMYVAGGLDLPSLNLDDDTHARECARVIFEAMGGSLARG